MGTVVVLVAVQAQQLTGNAQAALVAKLTPSTPGASSYQQNAASLTPDANGNVEITFTSVASGSYALTVEAQDAQGNVLGSTYQDPNPVVVAAAAPPPAPPPAPVTVYVPVNATTTVS
jgi:hypothetical protein